MAQPDQPESDQLEEPHAITLTESSQSPQTQIQIQTQSESQTAQSPISAVQALAIVALIVRVATWICLLVSLIILASNTATVKIVYRDVKIRFNNIYAYRYMMSAIVVGFSYTCLQMPFEIYQVSMGKRLMPHKSLPKFTFYADKILLSLLATGVGAAFGATFDLKKNLDDLDDYLEFLGNPILSQLRSKLDNFYNMAYVSAGFLLIAFLSSIASSIVSSLSLHQK